MYLDALIVTLLVVALILWVVGHPAVRIAIIVLIYAGVCGGAWYHAGPDDRWDVLVSISTALAVITALFSGEIQKLVYRATVSVYVADDLIDPAHNLLWIRGKVINSGY